MNAVTTRMGMFPSRVGEWKHARAFIEDFCAGAGLPRESFLKANLVVEELFLNTVKPDTVAAMIDEGVMIGSGGEEAAAAGRKHSNRPQPW